MARGDAQQAGFESREAPPDFWRLFHHHDGSRASGTGRHVANRRGSRVPDPAPARTRLRDAGAHLVIQAHGAGVARRREARSAVSAPQNRPPVER